MSRIKKIAAIASTSAAATAIAVAATAAPALAWTAGPYTANLSGNMTIDAGTAVTCSGSTLSGALAADGSLTVTSASISGCPASVTPKNLPWSGSLGGGNASISGFSVEALGCTYGGTINGTYSGGDTLPATVTFSNQKVSATGGFCLVQSVTLTATYVFSQ
ncbi:hypothetical protein [Actinomadura montaniterrae]|uniref:Protein activator of alkane oxidation PraB n=1 Tax=Actinomadura montaniterrae TaxID=1803903 RepID=A0A6L3VX32_9ACTN|nr:hypothetical protein [Actinomadura montaniterrae]KAB2381365.1 hypothetical protein F9B16_16140 [Actinomadura montaniterrae]